MRGRHREIISHDKAAGNTPAYAGKTTTRAPRRAHNRKHPRVCGEDPSVSHTAFYNTETPPRMRGRPVSASSSPVPAGNTPAYAGKTFHQEIGHLTSWKHPRVCGEDFSGTTCCNLTLETPPRMRGRLLRHDLLQSDLRNTPAYAGKTMSIVYAGGNYGKHPRVCGEDVLPTSVISYVPETPPRMRGRRHGNGGGLFPLGNTPAYAGKTKRLGPAEPA